jgi:tetratricopeptide (TPR) repeat protein
MAKKFYRPGYSLRSVLYLATLLLCGSVNVNALQGNGGYAAPYFQADFIQSLSDWASPLVNPALLYRVNQKHWDFGYYQFALGQQGLGFQQSSLVLPIMRNHTIALTCLWAINGIDLTDKYGKDLQTRAFFQDIWLIPSYGFRLKPWLMLGANAKMCFEKQFTGKFEASSIPGLDVGVYLNPFDNYRDLIGDLGFSVTLQDILPTNLAAKVITVNSGKIDSTNETVANRARVGIRWAGFNDNLVCDGELVVDNALISFFKAIKWNSYLNMFRSNADTTGRKDSIVGALAAALRGGFHVKYMFHPALWIKAGWTNNNIPYIGFNYNLIYLLPEMINYLNIDFNIGYSFSDWTGSMGDMRGFTTMFKVGTDFGQTREQILSKHLYDKLILAPMDAYNEAMRLYLAGKYWEAGFAFGKVLSLFPNFHLNDKAKWYLGDCYTKLYMDDIAREVFKEALEEYTTSEQRSRYIYGLLRLDYREGKYEEALKNHAFIINLYPESDIRTDADYLAGEIQFQRKNFNVAEQLLSRLKLGDPSYLYAQYTLAIINIENNKEQPAIQNLTAIIKDSTQEASDQLLQDAANLKLGHLYFESGDKLRQAVEAYQRVPEGSPFQDEALLGTSWAWMKVNRPQEAFQTIDHLIVSYPESSLLPESYLVKGYALMLLKRYSEAVSTLEQCLATAKKPFITDGDLQKRKGEFNDYVQKFAPTAEKIKKNTLRKPTNKVLEERTDMENEFQKYAKESRDFFNYTVLAKSHTRFFKRKDEVIADAEYALAKATNSMKSQKINESTEETKGKLDEIQKKKDEIKKKLEQLNKSGTDSSGTKKK